jgi:hypothetical protein
MSVNGTLVEDKMCRFKGECSHFSFNKCPIYTHDGARAKFSTNSHETDNSAWCNVRQKSAIATLCVLYGSKRSGACCPAYTVYPNGQCSMPGKLSMQLSQSLPLQ